MGSFSSPAIFTRQFNSAPQSLSSGGSLTIAHGLGVVPKDVSCDLLCVTIDGLWQVGDLIKNIGDGYTANNAANQPCYTLRADATNIYIIFASTTTIFRGSVKNTGAGSSFINANWNLLVRAYV